MMWNVWKEFFGVKFLSDVESSSVLLVVGSSYLVLLFPKKASFYIGTDMTS